MRSYTLLICIVLCLVSMALAQQRCPNRCNYPHGQCMNDGTCSCQNNWSGIDCSICTSFSDGNTRLLCYEKKMGSQFGRASRKGGRQVEELFFGLKRFMKRWSTATEQVVGRLEQRWVGKRVRGERGRRRRGEKRWQGILQRNPITFPLPIFLKLCAPDILREVASKWEEADRSDGFCLGRVSCLCGMFWWLAISLKMTGTWRIAV